MTTKEKLNQVHIKLRNDVKELCFKNLSYADRARLQILLDNLTSTNQAYQLLIKELEDKLGPELPPVSEKEKPEWKN